MNRAGIAARVAVAAGLSVSSYAATTLVSDVRAAIARNDFAQGESMISQFRSSRGATADVVEALSWLGRGALAQGKLDQADKYSGQAYLFADMLLKKGHNIDAEKSLEIGLGAAIEVQAQVMAARGDRGPAVSYLERELDKFGKTAVGARIQKNINLLSLVGKPAPSLSATEMLSGDRSQIAFKGQPALIFFWAHWCGDCKGMGPILARLGSEFGPKGLKIIAPTQTYGYVAGGQEVPAAQEVEYIKKLTPIAYPDLKGSPVPLSAADFGKYGASTTPTLVLIDKQGIVRMYHPGSMTYDELRPKVAAIFGAS
jgi:thiol-disulfide isomerase/thioredoxin